MKKKLVILLIAFIAISGFAGISIKYSYARPRKQAIKSIVISGKNTIKVKDESLYTAHVRGKNLADESKKVTWEITKGKKNAKITKTSKNGIQKCYIKAKKKGTITLVATSTKDDTITATKTIKIKK